jgi:hypothetical protein
MLDFITLLGCLCIPIAAAAMWRSLMRDIEQYEVRMTQLADNYGIRRPPEPKESDDGSL